MVIITHFLTMGWLMAFRWSRFNANSHGWAAISLDALVLRETLLAFFNSFLWCTIGIYSGILFIHQNLYDFKYLCNIWIIFFTSVSCLIYTYLGHYLGPYRSHQGSTSSLHHKNLGFFHLPDFPLQCMILKEIQFNKFKHWKAYFIV